MLNRVFKKSVNLSWIKCKQKSKISEIKRACLKIFSCWIGHATIESTEHLISNHILPVTSQILELRGKSFYISICITTTWNNLFMLLRINTFFLASTIDTCLTKLEGEIQTKNRSSKISKFVSWLFFFFVVVGFFFQMESGFYCSFIA